MNLDLRNRLMAAITAFREPNLIQDLSKPEDFDDFEGRINRYQILWGFYDNTIYNNIHKWARSYKLKAGLYKYTQGIFNPANRLGNFHQSHTWGGTLDPNAGDGTEEPSALPIITENEDIRPVIADIWRWSNWQVKKELFTLYGAVMGDSFIRVVDNDIKQRTYLELIHPTIVKDLTKDDFGNVKRYVLEEERFHPNHPTRKVTYTEIAERGEGDEVIFRTFLNNSLFPWRLDADDNPIAEWVTEYGFIPFVHNLHIDVGNKYGWSEMHAGRDKFDRANDVGTKIADYIRKEVETPWFFTGTQKPATAPGTKEGTESRDRPEPGREEKMLLYGGKDGNAIPLVSGMNIADASDYLQTIVKDIHRDYPEFMHDESEEVSGAESGVARRIRQQPAAAKVLTRRAAKDAALVTAHNMAMSIGAMRGYPGFEKLSPDGFKNKQFEHSIGRRDVFESDVFEELQESKLFWEVIAAAVASKVPLANALRSEGWSEEQITDTIQTSRSDNRRAATIEARRAARDLRQEQAVEIIDVGTEGQEPEAGQ